MWVKLLLWAPLLWIKNLQYQSPSTDSYLCSVHTCTELLKFSRWAVIKYFTPNLPRLFPASTLLKFPPDKPKCKRSRQVRWRLNHLVWSCVISVHVINLLCPSTYILKAPLGQLCWIWCVYILISSVSSFF